MYECLVIGREGHREGGGEGGKGGEGKREGGEERGRGRDIGKEE